MMSSEEKPQARLLRCADADLVGHLPGLNSFVYGYAPVDFHEQ